MSYFGGILYFCKLTCDLFSFCQILPKNIKLVLGMKEKISEVNLCNIGLEFTGDCGKPFFGKPFCKHVLSLALSGRGRVNKFACQISLWVYSIENRERPQVITFINFTSANLKRQTCHVLIFWQGWMKFWRFTPEINIVASFEINLCANEE